jgi:hypothetical protein
MTINRAEAVPKNGSQVIIFIICILSMIFDILHRETEPFNQLKPAACLHPVNPQSPGLEVQPAK